MVAYCDEAAVDKKELVLNFYLSIHIQLYRVCVIKKMDFESLIGIYCKFFLLQFRDLYSETPFIDNVFLRTHRKKNWRYTN